MDFHNVNLPSFIEIFAVGRSEFSTSVATSMSGREARSSDYVNPRRKYMLKGCRLSPSQFDSFNSFFIARGGRRYSFLLKDYFDYSVEKQLIATGSGKNQVEFQLNKIYPDEISSYTRAIRNIKENSFKCWIGDNEATPQNIDLKAGKVTLERALAENEELIASFEFNVQVRFVNDNFEYEFNDDGTISLNNIEMIEVIE